MTSRLSERRKITKEEEILPLSRLKPSIASDAVERILTRESQSDTIEALPIQTLNHIVDKTTEDSVDPGRTGKIFLNDIISIDEKVNVHEYEESSLHSSSVISSPKFQYSSLPRAVSGSETRLLVV